MMEKSSAPGPLVEIAIEAKARVDRERLTLALSELANEDPSFRVSSDQESGQTLLKGMSEQHLDLKLDILKRGYAIDIVFGAFQVSCRETITGKAEVDYTHKTQVGGSGQFARVKLVVEPNETGKGVVFESKIIGGAVPKDYIPCVEKGLSSVINSGVLAGFPVVDVRVQLVDGAFHAIDSSPLAFEIASRAALREGLQKGGCVLLEPIMRVEVVIPEDHAGSVIEDLKSRRGRIQSQDMRGDAVVIAAMVPLATTFGLRNWLLSRSQSRAELAMRFAHYARATAPNGLEPPPAATAALKVG